MEAGTGVCARPHPGRSRAIAAAMAAAVLLGIGAGVAVHKLSAPSGSVAHVVTAAPAFRGEATWPAGTRAAPAITTLADQSGRVFSLASLRGRTVAMEFFDSYCHQECPRLAGRALAAAERALPASERPVLVVVSVNPLDTPASSRAAVRAWGLASLAPWHWLRGTHAALARAWSAYHIYVAPPMKGDISHTEALYLIDRRGYERSGYLYPYAPRFVTHDLGALAAESRR